MNVICPLCKGPASQPIMEIYCKNECSRPKSTVKVVQGKFVIPKRVIIYGGTVYHVFDQPPSTNYKDSENLGQWVAPQRTEDDYTREIDGMVFNTMKTHGTLPWQPHHYNKWEFILLP